MNIGADLNYAYNLYVDDICEDKSSMDTTILNKINEVFDKKFEELFYTLFVSNFDVEFNNKFDNKFDSNLDDKFNKYFDIRFDKRFGLQIDSYFNNHFSRYFDEKYKQEKYKQEKINNDSINKKNVDTYTDLLNYRHYINKNMTSSEKKNIKKQLIDRVKLRLNNLIDDVTEQIIDENDDYIVESQLQELNKLSDQIKNIINDKKMDLIDNNKTTADNNINTSSTKTDVSTSLAQDFNDEQEKIKIAKNNEFQKLIQINDKIKTDAIINLRMCLAARVYNHDWDNYTINFEPEYVNEQLDNILTNLKESYEKQKMKYEAEKKIKKEFEDKINKLDEIEKCLVDKYKTQLKEENELKRQMYKDINGYVATDCTKNMIMAREHNEMLEKVEKYKEEIKREHQDIIFKLKNKQVEEFNYNINKKIKNVLNQMDDCKSKNVLPNYFKRTEDKF
jgi:hypothetical protein